MRIKRLLIEALVVFGCAGWAQAGGTGTASILPISVPVGSIITTTMTFTVPGTGLVAGGKLVVDLPMNWGPFPQSTDPNQPDYVLSSTTTFTIVPSSAQPQIFM